MALSWAVSHSHGLLEAMLFIEPRNNTVSVYLQDLELWIAKERLEDGYNLITRAGRTVQELKVTTDIPLDVMKSAVQTVLRRLA